MQKIIVVIDKQGETVLRTEGFTGSSCNEASAFLEKALGTKISDTPTDEMYAQVHQEQGISQ
jgi:hypothetical protein